MGQRDVPVAAICGATQEALRLSSLTQSHRSSRASSAVVQVCRRSRTVMSQLSAASQRSERLVQRGMAGGSGVIVEPIP